MSALGIYRLGRFLHRHQALILTYHGVLQKSHDLYTDRNSIDAAMFDRQMAFVALHYKVVPLSDLVQWLSTGQKLPPYTAVITFDDGCRNNFTVALPILKKYHLPATIFLATSFMSSNEVGLWTERVDWLIHATQVNKIQVTVDGIDKIFPLRTDQDREVASDQIRGHLKQLPPQEREATLKGLAKQSLRRCRSKMGSPGAWERRDFIQQALAGDKERYAFLTWEQARMMAQHQISFGSHTHTHSIMATLSAEEAYLELSESRRLIERELGTPCEFFSYPNGTSHDFGRRDQQLLSELGYIAAVTQIPGFDDQCTDRMALRRINISSNEDFNFCLAKLSGVWTLVKHLQSGLRLIGGK